ncbi:MAG: DUF2752 domain-containing protein [Cyanobacteria bacterium J06648_16]
MVLSRTGKYVRWGLLSFLAVPASVLGLQLLGYPVHLWGCPMKALTGIPCPTWGMTRSVVAIATLHPHQSLHYHLFGPLVLVLAPLLALLLAKELYTRRTSPLWLRLRQPAIWGAALLVAFTYHGWRLSQLWVAGTLQTDFHLSPLGHFVQAVL